MPEATYAYATPSGLSRTHAGARLGLATSGGVDLAGPEARPFFFSGFVEHPVVVAQGLLLLAKVARTRFYVPPNTLSAVKRAADPVVTSTAEGLRLESFSACCGVYARLDVDAGALDAAYSAPGVTNVDVNPPLRQALAGLRPTEPLHLSVGDDELRVSTLDGEVLEERVPLSHRWLKGFAETQMLAAGMVLQHQLAGPAIRAFIQGLPRTSATKTVMWATRAARGLRLASCPSPGAVAVAGPERLRVLEPLLRVATGLRAYGPPADKASLPLPSAWVLDVPGARVTIGLSPEKSRGFSGEGAVLTTLNGGLSGSSPVSESLSDDVDLISALLAFEPRIDPVKLAASSTLTMSRVEAALAALAAFGQVGYDLAVGAYFHRPLPLRVDLLDTLHPRLADAQQLVASGAVQFTDSGAAGAGTACVESKGGRYDVRLGAATAADRCTCPWYARYRGTRGPCKHVLAVRIASRSTPA